MSFERPERLDAIRLDGRILRVGSHVFCANDDVEAELFERIARAAVLVSVGELSHEQGMQIAESAMELGRYGARPREPDKSFSRDLIALVSRVLRSTTRETFTLRERALLEAAVDGAIHEGIQFAVSVLGGEIEISGDQLRSLNNRLLSEMESAMRGHKKEDR